MKATIQISIDLDHLVKLKALTSDGNSVSSIINTILGKHFSPASSKSSTVKQVIVPTQDTDIQDDDDIDENNPLFSEKEIKQAKFNKLKGLLTSKQPFKSTIEAIKAV